MRVATTVFFLLAAAINLIPLIGVVSAERLTALYGIPIEGPDLVILMRHRAVLFGIVGGLLAAAAFHPPLRTVAVIAGVVSMMSFVVVAALVGDYNDALRRVVIADVVGTVLLVLGAIANHR